MFEQARRAAQTAAEAEGRASNAALLAVEQCIAKYADRKQYLKLKDIAEASDIAAKVGPPSGVMHVHQHIE